MIFFYVGCEMIFVTTILRPDTQSDNFGEIAHSAPCHYYSKVKRHHIPAIQYWYHDTVSASGPYILWYNVAVAATVEVSKSPIARPPSRSSPRSHRNTTPPINMMQERIAITYCKAGKARI
jgi:hypothetical protein